MLADYAVADLGGSQGASEPPLILNSVLLMVSLPSVILYKHLLNSHRLCGYEPPFDFSRSATIMDTFTIFSHIHVTLLCTQWFNTLVIMYS